MAVIVAYIVVGGLLLVILYDDLVTPYLERRARKPKRYVVSGRGIKKKRKFKR